MHHSDSSPPSLASAIAYLKTFTDYEQALPLPAPRAYGLERITRLLSLLGDPHRGPASIHVTGTKGKGSVAHFADAILCAHGVSTFRFISPHVERLNERIALGGRDLPDDDLAAGIESLRGAVAQMGTDPPTFFEFMTALGFVAARRSRAEVDVLEVGLGGRLDSTNVVDPTVSVITSIDLDHTQILGATRDAIAAEKAGIIKPGRPVLVGLAPGDPGCDVILARAREVGAPALHRGGGISLRAERLARTRDGRPGVSFHGSAGDLSVAGAIAPGGGLHQATNAMLALCAASRSLAALGRSLDLVSALAALEAAPLPARAEPFGTRIQVLLDGAHTERSCAALAGVARWFFQGRRTVLLCGLTRERSLSALFRPFLDVVTDAVFAPIPTPRSADPEATLAEWRTLGGAGTAAATAPEALERALALAGSGGAVVVAGSFYLAGELRPLLRNLD